MTSAGQLHEFGCGTHAPAASLRSGSLAGLLAGQRVGAMKSGVSRVTAARFLSALWVGVLSCQQRSLRHH